MNQEELRKVVAEMLIKMRAEPSVKAESAPLPPTIENESVADITAVDLRKLYLVDHAHDAHGFQTLKSKTPARLGFGHVGTRYKTATMLRFRADHAAAQDSVFSLVHENFAKANGLIPVQTECKSKDEYLTRPDLGRRFDEANQKVIREVCGNHKVQIVIGDGLSSAAIEANAIDCAAAIEQGLTARNIDHCKKLFVKFCRVGAGDHIGDLTDCEVVCILVGERPGLVTNESMSAYITYRPHRGISESSRTVVSNIHAQGIAAVEAGAHIAALIEEILRKKVSGVALTQGQTP